MASTINATTGLLGGIVSTGDTSGQLELQADGTTKLTVSSSGVTIPTLVGANVSLTSNVTGTLPVANGGTGATTLTGYVKGAGTSALSASSTIPGSDISGNISGNAANVTGTIAVANGGTGSTSLTANNVLLGNGTSAVQTVAPGANGNILTSNGTTWQSTAPAGGGAWTYLSTVTANNSATVDVENAFTGYDLYAITVVGLRPTQDQFLRIRFKIGGSYLSAGYYYHSQICINGNGSYLATQGSNSDSAEITGALGSGSSSTCNWVFYIPHPSSTSLDKKMWWHGMTQNYSDTRMCNGTMIVWNQQAALTGVRFYISAGNISIGTFRLYGIKNS